jgi:hypothetical protein
VNRKQRRAIKKHVGAEAQEKMSNQIAQFGKMPGHCSACKKDFDQKDKDMAQTWSVVVRQEIVRLFCPDCIATTREAADACT